jgi:uroporphyrinogen III methyltransferase/synthase
MPDTDELDRAISNLEHYHWAIFTSVNGVNAFFQQLSLLKMDARIPAGLKVGAIGPATAEALKMMGVIPDYLPEVYTGQGIIAGLESRDIVGQRFLLTRADIADKELTEGITRLGAEVDEIAVYKTVPAVAAISQAKEMLLSGEIDIITFASSSTVSNLMAVFDGEQSALNSAKVACIGPKTADTAARAGLRVDIVAGEHTIPGLVTAIEEHFKKED